MSLTALKLLLFTITFAISCKSCELQLSQMAKAIRSNSNYNRKYLFVQPNPTSPDMSDSQEKEPEQLSDLRTQLPITKVANEEQNEQQTGESLDRIVPENEDAKGDSVSSDDAETDNDPCGDDKYYHIRGERCVPLTCRLGNKYRDFETGECIYSKYSRLKGFRSSPRFYWSRRMPLLSSNRGRFGYKARAWG